MLLNRLADINMSHWVGVEWVVELKWVTKEISPNEINLVLSHNGHRVISVVDQLQFVWPLVLVKFWCDILI